jgi:uncharacterized membrane protein YvbJ
MVYCTKCGAKNDEDTTICVKCGASLVARPWRYERGERTEQECFGLPHGGTIAALVIGMIIILVGITSMPGIEIEWWPLVIIIFGILIVAGTLYRHSRRY